MVSIRMLLPEPGGAREDVATGGYLFHAAEACAARRARALALIGCTATTACRKGDATTYVVGGRGGEVTGAFEGMVLIRVVEYRCFAVVTAAATVIT